MGRVAIAALLAAIALTLASTAGSAGKQSFHDAFGDVDCCTRDLTDVIVRNDDAGTVTFEIHFDDRFEGSDDDDLYVLLDTDRNPATGQPAAALGVDYMLGAHVMPGRADGVFLYRWDGTQLREYRVRSLHTLVHGHTILVTVDRHLLGDTEAFDFRVEVWEVAHGYSYSDLAPDSGAWSFPLRIATARLRPTLDISRHPRAGHRFVARLALRVARTRRLLGSGQVLCQASVGGRRLQPVFSAFAARRAVCAWQLPTRAHGKTIRGSVGVAVTSDSRVSRRFAAAID